MLNVIINPNLKNSLDDKAHYMSEWTDIEGLKNNFVDGYGNTFNLQEGDDTFYHADQIPFRRFQIERYSLFKIPIYSKL